MGAPFLMMPDNESADLRYRLRDVSRIPIANVSTGALVKVRGHVATDGAVRSPTHRLF